mgnify:FL=1
MTTIDQLNDAARRFHMTFTPDALGLKYVWQPHEEYDRYGGWTGVVTDEVLTDLTEWFNNKAEDAPVEETIMNIYGTELFKYLAGDMIGDKTIALTIGNVTEERMNSGKGGEQIKPCLHFRERNKLMVLNKTNAKFIAGFLGPETSDWIGARVSIEAPVGDAFGKRARILRIVHVEPAPRPAQQQRPAANGNGAAVQTEQPAAQDDLLPAEALPFVDPA